MWVMVGIGGGLVGKTKLLHLKDATTYMLIANRESLLSPTLHLSFIGWGDSNVTIPIAPPLPKKCK